MVPRLYHNEVVICIGSGPSLTASDLSLVYDAVHTPARKTKAIAVNSAYVFAPWCNDLFAGDAKWWGWHPDALTLPAFKFAFPPTQIAGVTTLEWSTGVGLDLDPTRLRSGGHSGYAAVNLAVHRGARRIILLGYDLAPAVDGRHHVGEEHPDGSHPSYAFRRSIYQTLLTPLERLGIEIVNASRRTAIPDIPRVPLNVALMNHGVTPCVL